MNSDDLVRRYYIASYMVRVRECMQHSVRGGSASSHAHTDVPLQVT